MATSVPARGKHAGRGLHVLSPLRSPAASAWLSDTCVVHVLDPASSDDPDGGETAASKYNKWMDKVETMIQSLANKINIVS